MVTPIRPSLAQMLNGTTPSNSTAAPKAAQQPAAQAGGFASALAAQKSFFQQVASGQIASGQAAASPPQMTQKITPATFTAADIARASTPVAAADADTPPKRPGSFLNIVV